MASLADLLDYDQRKKQALQALTDYASSQYKLGSAFGEGLSDQAKGLAQMVMHPIDTATQMYQAGKSVVQNPKAAYQAAKEGLTEAVSSPQNIARFAGQNFNPLELANALNKVGTMRELTVYHGTPHKFEPTPDNPLGEFTASKIGTGEGAAAYGHGIYVAQNPSVAESYKHAGALDRGFAFGDKTGLTRSEVHDMVNAKYGNKFLDNVTKPSGVADQFMDDMIIRRKIREEGEYPRGYKAGSERAKLYDELRNKISTSGDSSLYTVDLPDEKIDQMLDWDKPLSEQSAHVQNAVLGDINLAIEQTKARMSDASERKASATKIELEKLEKEKNRMLNLFGEDLYKQMSLGEGKFAPDASSQLRQLGIPGIKYLDEQSRAKGAGTRNFVVFPGEEKNLKILSRE